jgi:branched-chain amino acid transport system permease protein
MGTLFNILVDGVTYGMILFMIAVGLSVTMGLMRVINLAHGGFALVAGASTHWLTVTRGVGFWPAVAGALVFTVALAILLERMFYRGIYRMGELQQVLATIGIAFLMIAAVNYLLGSTILSIPLPDVMRGSVDLGVRTLPVHRVFVILAGIGVLAGLYLLIDCTRFGISLRAAVDNRDTAATLGINTSRIYALAFALGAALAGMGGILGAELLPIDANYPLRYMVLFLIVVAVGGLGSIAGSFVAALGLGIVDTAARYLFPGFGTIFFYAFMMAVLTLRPRGLLGRA